MSPFRPTPHRSLPGSVRPQELPRLVRLRRSLARRWQRRQRRQLVYLALAFVAGAASFAMVVGVVASPAWRAARTVFEHAALALYPAGVLLVGIYSLWRFDRSQRRARAAAIRFHHANQRILAHERAADGVGAERPVA